MSAQQLAARCADLGMEVPRAVLANLENGRRPLVSVAELLILAAALEVPPVTLIAPIGHQPTTELLPGVDIPTLEAAEWINGDIGLVRLEDGRLHFGPLVGTASAVGLVRTHQGALERWRTASTSARSAAWAVHAAAPEEEPRRRAELEGHQRNVAHFESEIANIRTHMREAGLTVLPPLPAELSHLDAE